MNTAKCVFLRLPSPHHTTTPMTEFETVVALLKQSQLPQSARSAEQQLKELEDQADFPIVMLHVVAAQNLEESTRLAAALFFKNFLKRKWVNSDGQHLLQPSTVKTVKDEVVGLMISLPERLQIQLGESVSIIADSDFPHNWEDLVSSLVARLSPTDMVTNNGILTVAHSIFKKWRPLFSSDDLNREILLVLNQFTEPYKQLCEEVDRQIEANSNNKAQLDILFRVQFNIFKIFFDLNCQDIPAFFEDNLDYFMNLLKKYLCYTNPLLEDPDEDDEAGILEKVKASICDAIQLYSLRYEEFFGTYLNGFVETVWNLLTNTSTQPKYDILVSRALTFLTSVAKVPRHTNMFSSPEVLKQLIEKIVVPNMSLRESDEELFEDDPLEYIRRDLEGSDSDTRRRAATDFLRELNDKAESSVTKVALEYVEQFLNLYKQDPASNWKAKDTAIHLYSSIAAKGAVTSSGVTSINLTVDILSFFSENIAPDLMNDSANPILKVDAIKYIYTFRNQLSRDHLIQVFPVLMNHLLSTNYVVCTYSAVTVERLLAKNVFDKTEVAEIAQQLLPKLFELIAAGGTPEKISENEYLMKCIMRILLVAGSDVATGDAGKQLLQQLIGILQEICKNPSNPRFNHYTFESIGVLLKYTVPVVGFAAVQDIVSPTFLTILEQDIAEFSPYVFQLLALILELSPSIDSLPPAFQQLARTLVVAQLWESRGNVPALARLLKAIISKNGSIYEENLLALLGVFQKLISSRVNDEFGFDLLQAIMLHISPQVLQPHLKDIAVILLMRLQGSRTEKFVNRFAYFVVFLAATAPTPSFPITFIDQAEKGVFGTIWGQFLVNAVPNVQGPLQRKTAAIGCTKLLTGTPEFLGGEYSSLWPTTLEKLVQLLNSEISKSTEEVSPEVDLDSLSFGSSFNKLSTCTPKPTDPLPDIRDAKQFFVQQLQAANNQTNGQVNQLIGNSSEAVKTALRDFGYA